MAENRRRLYAGCRGPVRPSSVERTKAKTTFKSSYQIWRSFLSSGPGFIKLPTEAFSWKAGQKVTCVSIRSIYSRGVIYKMGWGLRCALLWVGILAVVRNAGASWQVDHAFGDDAFTPAGTLSESVQASKWLSRCCHPRCCNLLVVLSCDPHTGAAANKRCQQERRQSTVAPVDRQRRVRGSAYVQTSHETATWSALLLNILHHALAPMQVLQNTHNWRRKPANTCSSASAMPAIRGEAHRCDDCVRRARRNKL